MGSLSNSYLINKFYFKLFQLYQVISMNPKVRQQKLLVKNVKEKVS